MKTSTWVSSCGDAPVVVGDDALAVDAFPYAADSEDEVVDIAYAVVDGTCLVAEGQPNVVAAVAVVACRKNDCDEA